MENSRSFPVFQTLSCAIAKIVCSAIFASLLFVQNGHAADNNCINSIRDNVEYCYTEIPECVEKECPHGLFSIKENGKTSTIILNQAPFSENKQDNKPAITQYYLQDCQGEGCKNQDYFLVLWGDNGGAYNTAHFFNPKDKTFTELSFGWSGKANLEKIDHGLYFAVQENRLRSILPFGNLDYPVYFEIYVGTKIIAKEVYNQRAEKFYLHEIDKRLRKHRSTNNDAEPSHPLFEAFIIAYRMRNYNPKPYKGILELVHEFCKINEVAPKTFGYFMEDLGTKLH